MTPLTEYADFHRTIVAFALTAVRIVAAMEVLPALSSSMVTGLARRAAALAFAALAVPMTLNQMPPYESLSIVVLAPVVIKEAQEIRSLDPVTLAFASCIGNVPKESFRCCTSKQ